MCVYILYIYTFYIYTKIYMYIYIKITFICGFFASQGKKSVCQAKPPELPSVFQVMGLLRPPEAEYTPLPSCSRCTAGWERDAPDVEAAGLSPTSLAGVAGLHSKS